MKVGIIGAMEQEVMLLRNFLNHSTFHQYMGYEIYTGQVYGIEVVLLKSGIGKVSAALGTTLLLDHFNPDIVINTGSAGSLSPSLKIGDIVVSHEVCYHDVDITAFGYEPGQMAQCPISFNADPLLVVLAEKIIHLYGIHAVRGLLVSGDAFINSTEELIRIRKTFPQAVAVEMEAAAIAHVCHKFTVPFVVVRAISDIVNKASYISFEEFLNVASQKSSLLVKKILSTLAD